MINEKQKECQDLVDEINSTFDVDLRTETKDISVIWFRYYIINKFKYEHNKVCYIPLNKTNGAINYLKKQLPLKITSNKYKDILKVIESKDVNRCLLFLNKYFDARKEKKKQQNMLNKSTVNVVKKVSIKKLQMPTGDAMILLRKNPQSPLWNKEIYRWSFSDWNELKNY